MARFQRLVPCLWCDSEAEEAVRFYTSIFDNSRIVRVTRYTAAGQEFHGKPEGSVMSVVFTLDGQEFTALNGGPHFKFTEAISLQAFCETQEEIDHYWWRLTADGGDEGSCGWLKDRFGLSWQVTPLALEEWLADPDPSRVKRVLTATPLCLSTRRAPCRHACRPGGFRWCLGVYVCAAAHRLS